MIQLGLFPAISNRRRCCKFTLFLAYLMPNLDISIFLTFTQDLVEHTYKPDPNTITESVSEEKAEGVPPPPRDSKRKSTKETAARRVARKGTKTSAPEALLLKKSIRIKVGLEAHSIRINVKDMDEEEDDDQGTLTDLILRERCSKNRADRLSVVHPPSLGQTKSVLLLWLNIPLIMLARLQRVFWRSARVLPNAEVAPLVGDDGASLSDNINRWQNRTTPLKAIPEVSPTGEGEVARVDDAHLEIFSLVLPLMVSDLDTEAHGFSSPMPPKAFGQGGDHPLTGGSELRYVTVTF
ncbi:hypothetical protein Q3G72_001136 [Acer saccharum]|nr:hypothetical protein Q3G72_001136 [Acer saccharum]